MVRGVKVLTGEQAREVVDLYAWGMDVWIICALYGMHKTTVREYARAQGVEVRKSGRPKSSRQRSHADAAELIALAEGAYQSIREHAQALRVQRIARRPVDVSTRSSPEVASASPRASLRSGSRLQDHE